MFNKQGDGRRIRDLAYQLRIYLADEKSLNIALKRWEDYSTRSYYSRSDEKSPHKSKSS